MKTVPFSRNNVIAFVPAKNEVNGIRSTIESLLNQTHKIDVVIISDNSTDDTVSIVRSIAATNNRVSLIETVNNKFKKSGALNIAYRSVDLEPYDYVLSMDGDTVIAPDLVEQGLIEFQLDPKLGAVCSRAGLIEKKTHSLTEKLLYHLQRVEYAEFDTSRIERYGFTKVVHGMCAIYKKEAIETVKTTHEAAGKHDQVYDEGNITEDYELTICLRENGYNTTIGLGMHAWTDVPLNIKGLWKQRIRWLRGGLDTLWEHGWNKVTRRDIMNTIFFWFVLFFQVTLLGYILFDLISQGTLHLNFLVVLVMSMMYIDCVYRLRYVQKITKWDYIVRVTFVAQILYSWFTIAQQLYAYYLFVFKPEQEW